MRVATVATRAKLVTAAMAQSAWPAQRELSVQSVRVEVVSAVTVAMAPMVVRAATVVPVVRFSVMAVMVATAALVVLAEPVALVVRRRATLQLRVSAVWAVTVATADMAAKVATRLPVKMAMVVMEVAAASRRVAVSVALDSTARTRVHQRAPVESVVSVDRAERPVPQEPLVQPVQVEPAEPSERQV